MVWFIGAVLAAAVAGDPFIPEPPRPEPTTAKPQKSDPVADMSELEELRAEVRDLKQQNADLLQELAELKTVKTSEPLAVKAPAVAKTPAAPAAKGPPVPPRKSYSRIEVGMTRADVDRFITSHRNLKLVSVSASSGVTAQSDETVVRRESTGGASVVRRGGVANGRDLGPGVVDEAQGATNDEQKQVVEHRTVRGKRETLTIANMVSRRVRTGEKRNAVGGMSPVYGSVRQESGRLTITMTDDIVTAVEGMQN